MKERRIAELAFEWNWFSRLPWKTFSKPAVITVALHPKTWPGKRFLLEQALKRLRKTGIVPCQERFGPKKGQKPCRISGRA
jgi:hypothetical protein